MVKRASQTKRLSGRAQRTLEIKNRADDQHAAHRRRALFAAVQFGETMHFCRGRIGCPTLSAINFRMTQLPKMSESTKAVTAAATARNVT